jgi:hypothetical protein
MHTTARTSSTKAYEDWKKAQRAVELAARKHADTHTGETKRALQNAREAESKALKNYSQSRLVTYSAVLSKQARVSR